MADIKILLIDDSGTMRKIEIMSLAKIGFKQVIEAVDGAEGLKKLAEEKPDLVLCDWNMPEMNGLQFVNAVRKNADFKEVPIIMLTTVDTRDEIMAVIKAGANDYLHKPFTPEALKEKIDKQFAAK